MIENKNKEMTFSPYASVSKKKGTMQQQIGHNPIEADISENESEQLCPDDLYMDYSQQQLNDNHQSVQYEGSQSYRTNFGQHNHPIEGQHHLDQMNYQHIQQNQNQQYPEIFQNSHNSYMNQYMQNLSKNDDSISTPSYEQLPVNNHQQEDNESNYIDQSQSYILNSSKFINHNISSILGNNNSHLNNYSNNISCSLLQNNSSPNRQEFINVYEDNYLPQGQTNQLLPNQNQYCVYKQDESNNQIPFINEYSKYSLRDQIHKRLENTKLNEQNVNFYKHSNNQENDTSNRGKSPFTKQMNTRLQQQQSIQHLKRNQSNSEIFRQDASNHKDFNVRRNSINDVFSNVSFSQNQSCQSMQTPQTKNTFNQNNMFSNKSNNVSKQKINNSVQNISKNDNISKYNSNSKSILSSKKQLLFSMIVETPDARQEVINVFEGAQLQQLAIEFCQKNNMEAQKYSNFITERLQEAVNHFYSFDSPQNQQRNQITNSFDQIQKDKLDNSQSVIFQVTQKGINQILNEDSISYPYQKNNKSQISQGSYQVCSQSDDNVEVVQVTSIEQVFELPYKSLIYELDLSNMPDEIQNNNNNSKLNDHSTFSENQYQYRTEQPKNTCDVKAINQAGTVTITLNPIENITQKMNEQINVNSIFEEQVQSNCQSIGQLKQSIQKSLAKQYDIQQEFHRRYNSYTQSQDTNKIYSSIEKSSLQQSNNILDEQSPRKNAQILNSAEMSNHFNRYDILKYQESQESARQVKLQAINKSIEKDLLPQKNEQIIQSDKYSVKILSPLQEERYNNNVSEFQKNEEQAQENLISKQQNILNVRLQCKNSSFYSPTSTNSYEQCEKNILNKEALFFCEKGNDTNTGATLKQNLKSEHSTNFRGLPHGYKQNMCSLASQFDDLKNGELGSLKGEEERKENSNMPSHQQNQENSYDEQGQSQNFTTDGMPNYSSIQKGKQVSDSESMRMFDEKQHEAIPGSYRVCQSRIEYEELSKDYFLPSNFNSNVSQQQQQNSFQNEFLPDQLLDQNQQQIWQNNNQLEQINSGVSSITCYNPSDDVNKLQEISNSSLNNQLNKEIVQFPTNSQEFNNQKNQKSDSQNKAKNSKYLLPPVSSNSKNYSYSNGGVSGLSTNRNSSNYSSNNQNLSSVKRNLFAANNNSQKSLKTSTEKKHQTSTSQIQQQYQNENISHQQSNVSTARGSLVSQSKEYDSILTSSRTPISKSQNSQQKQQSLHSKNLHENQSNMQSNISTARGSGCSTSKGYDSVPVSYRTPNSKPCSQQKQLQRPQIDQSENFDQIKQTIFNSIMKSNPSQIMNDVKQIKFNLSPYLEQSKLNQQMNHPSNEYLVMNSGKQTYQQIHGRNRQPSSSSLYQKKNNNKNRNNSISNLRSSKNGNDSYCSFNQNSSFINGNKNEKRSSSTNTSRHQYCKTNNSEANLLKQPSQQYNHNSGFSTVLEGPISYNLSNTPKRNFKMNANQNFKQRIFDIFSILDSDCDGYISADNIEIRSINDLVLFILTPILIEIFSIQRSVNIEEFNCAFMKLFFNLPKQQQDIIIDRNVEICWIDEQGQSQQNLEFFNFNSPLYQQYIDKKNTLQMTSNKTYNWMLDLSNKEFLDFYMSNFKSLVKETNKYLS